MMTKTEVLIAGGGIAGLALACRLGAAGIATILVDPKPLTTVPEIMAKDARTAALLHPALTTLRTCGVDPEKLPDTAPLETLSLIDLPARTGGNDLRIDFHADELGEIFFGLNIRNAILQDALLKQVQTLKTVQLICGPELAALTENKGGINATLTDGKTLRAQLVVGADGRTSKVRDLAGIPASISPYHQKAIIAIIRHTRPHANTSVEFHRPGGPFTLVPLSGNRSSVVWMENEEDANTLIQARKDDFTARLQEETHNLLGTVALETPPQSWDIVLIRAKTLTAPRIALMAEAAHALPPSGAQGLNLSLRDVEDLARELVRAHHLGLDPGSPVILRRYTRARQLDITTCTLAVDGLNRLIRTDSLPLRRLRRTGLEVLSSLPPIRHTVMRFGWRPS